MAKKINFKEHLKIDKGNMNNELSKIVTEVYDFGIKQIKLDEEVDKLELRLEIVEAKLSNHTRNKYRNLKKTLSETHVKDIVKTNPEVTELREKLITSRKAQKLAKLRMKALLMKSNSIDNIGHNIRSEGKI